MRLIVSVWVIGFCAPLLAGEGEMLIAMIFQGSARR